MDSNSASCRLTTDTTSPHSAGTVSNHCTSFFMNLSSEKIFAVY